MIWRKVLIMILKRKRKSLAFIRGGKVSGMKSDGANLMLYYLECQGGRELLMSFIKYNYCVSSVYFNYTCNIKEPVLRKAKDWLNVYSWKYLMEYMYWNTIANVWAWIFFCLQLAYVSLTYWPGTHWQLRGRQCKSSCKNPLCISHRTTSPAAVDDHIWLLNDFENITRHF